MFWTFWNTLWWFFYNICIFWTLLYTSFWFYMKKIVIITFSTLNLIIIFAFFTIFMTLNANIIIINFHWKFIRLTLIFWTKTICIFYITRFTKYTIYFCMALITVLMTWKTEFIFCFWINILEIVWLTFSNTFLFFKL